jgi:hypothetical protein
MRNWKNEIFVAGFFYPLVENLTVDSLSSLSSLSALSSVSCILLLGLGKLIKSDYCIGVGLGLLGSISASILYNGYKNYTKDEPAAAPRPR